MTEQGTKRRVKRGWMPLQITKIIDETNDTKTFVFEDAEDKGRQFDYVPGQYLTFRYDGVEAKPLVRSYTMSSSPCIPNETHVTVKRVEGGVISNWMCDRLKVGDVLKARGPIGKFCYFAEDDAPNLVMIAAGSGVTPFTSMLREFTSKEPTAKAPKTMTLLVSFRSTKDLINQDALKIASDHPTTKIVTTLTREKAEGFLSGRISEEMLESVLENQLYDHTFMTCGPVPMMDMVVEFLKEKGVPENRIKLETFEN